MLNIRSVLFSKWLLVTSSALVLLVPACSAQVDAQPPPSGPTAQVQPGFQPGGATPTRALEPAATLVPGDPNQPVSNKTPMTAAPNSTQASISGRVTNAQGEPIARARLAFSDSSVPLPEMAYATNADGKYRIAVPRGVYTLTVTADGYASQERKLDTRQEAQVQTDFILQPQ
ncbi:MAG: hypothetical protein HDKAJFGB_00777 [Anaerolineae bacterium]|nr:hypothetical protein [Anaerolineae bacterium]